MKLKKLPSIFPLSHNTTLTGLGIGAAVGFMLGGPVGAVAGATFGGKWGKRTPKLMDDIRCPKCNHVF